jgi:predicted transcriptional regulator
MIMQEKRIHEPDRPGGRDQAMLEKVNNEIDLLSRHLLVVKAVVKNQPIGIMKLSELLDLPFHRIRYSLRILEHLGYIRASPAGAVATRRANELLHYLNEDLDQLIGHLESMKEKEA